MEETKKSRNDRGGNNKMVIKIGGGGGVVGAVIVLGGALATAAFASAFLLGQKRRSSDKDHRQNSSPDINDKSEKEDEHLSKGAKEEAELEKDSTIMISAHSLKVDVEAISDDGFIIVKPSSEITLLAEKEGKDKVELTKEDVYSKESTNLGQVYIEDESGVEGDDKHVNMEVEKKEFVEFCNGSGEMDEEKSVNGCIVHVSAENILPMQFDAKNNVVEKENGGEEVEEDDVKRASEEEDILDHGNGEAPRKEERERGGVVMELDCGKGDSSKWEALWQAERPKVAVSYEVEGKIQEDKIAEMGMRSTRMRIVVWTLSVLSSLSCSCFLGLSFAKLCLLVFLTVFLLDIYGYPLLSPQQPRSCLHASKGESGYEQRS